MEYFSNPVVIWFIVGFVLFILELAVPGLLLLFFGAGAWIVAISTWIFDLPFEAELGIFIVSSLVLLFSLRKQLKRKFFDAKENKQGVLDDEFVGKTATALTSFSSNAFGQVQFKGAPWKAKSDSNIEEGDLVEIIDKESITLIVKPKN